MSKRMLEAAEAVLLYLSDAQRVRRYGAPLQELRFAAPYRGWRLDLAYPFLLAIEIEGGTFAHAPGAKSRHTTGSGVRDDAIKYNIAALLGWTVIRLTTDMVEDGTAWTLLDAALETRHAQFFGAPPAPSTTQLSPIPAPLVALIQAMPKQQRSGSHAARPPRREAVA